jgi:methoxymalonate biosynthesis acyl carrier protein
MNIQILTSEAPAAARRTRVRAFIVRVVGDNLQDDQDLFGLKDSLFAMELLAFVEDAFKIRVNPEDLSIHNFRSVNAICALIERKLG